MSTLSLRAAAPAALALILLLAACGSASTDASVGAPEAADASTAEAPTTPDETDPTSGGGGLCALVPSEEVETALGMATDGGVDDESFITGGQTCRFTGDPDHVVDVSFSEQSRDEWFEQIETVGLTDEIVEGVGDEAYRAPETALGGPGARFTAWAGGREVGVTIYSDADQEVTLAAAQAIAVAVLGATE